MGRERVKLHWQVAPLGTPFTATTIISGTSSSWITTTVGGLEISQDVSGLTLGTPYHWRARLLYWPGNRMGQPASRWIHMPWNGWNELDFWTDQPCSAPANLAFDWDPDYPRAEQDVTFTGRAEGTPPLTVEWDFGDGGTASGNPAVHSYDSAGNYQVVMTVTGACGSPATLQQTVTMLEATGIYLPVVVRNQ
jgi:PKD repeat protein